MFSASSIHRVYGGWRNIRTHIIIIHIDMIQLHNMHFVAWGLCSIDRHKYVQRTYNFQSAGCIMTLFSGIEMKFDI